MVEFLNNNMNYLSWITVSLVTIWFIRKQRDRVMPKSILYLNIDPNYRAIKMKQLNSGMYILLVRQPFCLFYTRIYDIHPGHGSSKIEFDLEHAVSILKDIVAIKKKNL